MCAVPSKVIFCSSLMLIWPGILSRYVSSPFLIARSAPMITGIISVLMPHIRFVSISKSWSWAAIMNPSVSDFNPLLLSHWLVLWWSTSASFILSGYLPWRALSSHCFVSFSWVLFRAICLVLFAYLMVVSSARLSGIVRCSSWLNCSACLCIEYNFFLPSCSCTSLIRVSSVLFRYVSSPIAVVL